MLLVFNKDSWGAGEGQVQASREAQGGPSRVSPQFMLLRPGHSLSIDGATSVCSIKDIQTSCLLYHVLSNHFKFLIPVFSFSTMFQSVSLSLQAPFPLPSVNVTCDSIEIVSPEPDLRATRGIVLGMEVWSPEPWPGGQSGRD